ncbi:MAG: DUF4926 domain-containing protein [Mycobacterium sp.]
MKPEEHDLVRLVRCLPEHDLPAGAEGTVVKDYTLHSGPNTRDLPPAYEVEFPDDGSTNEFMVTLRASDLEVVRRCHPHRGKNDVAIEEHDVVRLVHAVPEYNAPAGAQCTVLLLVTAEGSPPGCAVEFAPAVGTTEPWFTIPAAELELVWRPGIGWLPGFGPAES